MDTALTGLYCDVGVVVDVDERKKSKSHGWTEAP
jgi:hypothetical protein